MSTELLDGFSGAGSMGTMTGAMDWSETPLGLVEGRPHTLRTVVRIRPKRRNDAEFKSHLA
jgi:hypothetical protein